MRCRTLAQRAMGRAGARDYSSTSSARETSRRAGRPLAPTRFAREILLILLVAVLLKALRDRLPPLLRIALSDTRALNLNCNDSPERGTIAELVALAVLVRRAREKESSYSLRSRNLINLICGVTLQARLRFSETDCHRSTFWEHPKCDR